MADNSEKPKTAHVEEEAIAELAYIANHDEHVHGKWQSIKKYPLAFFWSLYAVWCVLLVSFENQAAGNIIGIPEFRKDFGHAYEGSYVIPASWQSAFQGAPVAS
jgi:MFS transporter, SP family, general alpha glucoside:H+ symporter